jgi:hypothetical protein
MKGKIKSMSKYGGLILENQTGWFNPADDILKNYVLDNIKKDDYVELELKSDRIYSKIEVVKEENDNTFEEECVTDEIIEEIDYPTPVIETETSFKILNTKSVEIEKKGNLNYSSWAELWSELKKEYNEANFIIHEWNGIPYLKTEEGVFTKVSVSVNDITHTILLPVMDFKNQAIKNPDAMQINKTIMRNLAKAISLHGLGMFLYRGEDLKED